MKWFKNFSLKNKLMFMFTAAILVPALAVFIELNMLKNKIVQEKADAMFTYASGVSHNISSQFFERYGDVQAFSKNNALWGEDKKAATEALNRYAELYGFYDLIVLIDADGKYLTSNNLSPKGKAIDVKNLESYDYSKEEFFKAAKEERYTSAPLKGMNGTHFTDVHIDPLTSAVYGNEKLGTAFSTKVFDSTGAFKGVLTARANMSWIENEVKAVYFQLKKADFATSNIIITRHDGKVIVDYNPSEFEWNEEVQHDLKELQLVKDLSKESPTISKALKGELGSLQFYDEIEKHNHVGGFMPLTSEKWIDSIGWAVAVELNEADATKTIDQQLVVLYVGIGLITLLFLTWALTFSRSISTQFNTLAKQVEDGAGNILSSSHGIASTAGQLSQAVNEQAASLQETVASIDEINAMVAKNADSAKSSKDMAVKSKELAEGGKQTVEQMLSAINDITQSNEDINREIAESNRKIAQIVNVISEIGQKTKVINDIVFQTKLLSFNASVEAARAGEHGKGFAVVAEEVGNLASMSGNAAKEISSLLESSTSHVEGIVKETSQKIEVLMRNGREKVQRGTATAQDCSQSLEEIISNVSSLTELVSEIAVASEEQAHGITQVTQAMAQLDNVTQQNTVVANNSSQSSEELRTQSESLNQVVVQLRLMVNGTETPVKEVKTEKVVKTSPEKATVEKKKKKTESVKKASKVIELPARVENKKNETSPTFKKAASGETPSADDPRFEEV